MSGSGYPPPPSLQYAAVPAQQQMPLANPARGGIKLFRLFGIAVYAHWSWLIFAVYGVQSRAGHYSSFGWNVAEFLAWVLIVMLHEFGHAFACLSVGGSVDRIVLWPLGGSAYTQSPPRPGTTLWTVAGGPLVNALLVPILFGAHSIIPSFAPSPDLNSLLWITKWINVILLVIQLLPFYPLDGGVILQCILWFFMSRWRSIVISASIGIAGAIGWGVYAIYDQNLWMDFRPLRADAMHQRVQAREAFQDACERSAPIRFRVPRLPNVAAAGPAPHLQVRLRDRSFRHAMHLSAVRNL